MADDLDQLLDEVELRFCRDRSATSREEKEEAARVGRSDKEVKISSPSVSPEETTKEEDDLSDLIEDIFHDNPSVSDPSKSSPRAITNCAGHRAFSQTKGRKTCDQLRCTTCDFRVIALDDYEWNKSCDYFFFRNNMPDLTKLKVKTLSKRGARAYACQCSWRSIHDLTDLREEQQLRWVCGKH